MADIALANSTYSSGTNDTASTLINNVTATAAQQWNGIATAIVGVENTLGVATTLIGNKADLVERLAVCMDANGLLKLSTDSAVVGPLSTAKGGTGDTTNRMPVGSVIVWTTTTAPGGFLLCDGSAVSRATYAGLFAVVGTTYGAGDGATTFNLPDMRGRVIIMVDGAAARVTSASTNGANADTLGGVGGAQTHTLSTAELPSHTHATIFGTGTGSTYRVAGDGDTTPSSTFSTGSTGGGAAHSNTQPWIALEYIIKT